MSVEFNEEDILGIHDLEEEGFYWIADTSEDEPEWFIAWVSGEPGSARDDDSDDDDYNEYRDDIDHDDEDEEEDEDFEYAWEYSTTPDDFSQDLDDSYIFLGPVSRPEVNIPVIAPKPKLEFTKVPVELPSSDTTVPTLVPILKIIKR